MEYRKKHKKLHINNYRAIMAKMRTTQKRRALSLSLIRVLQSFYIRKLVFQPIDLEIVIEKNAKYLVKKGFIKNNCILLMIVVHSYYFNEL